MRLFHPPGTGRHGESSGSGGCSWCCWRLLERSWGLGGILYLRRRLSFMGGGWGRKRQREREEGNTDPHFSPSIARWRQRPPQVALLRVLQRGNEWNKEADRWRRLLRHHEISSHVWTVEVIMWALSKALSPRNSIYLDRIFNILTHVARGRMLIQSIIFTIFMTRQRPFINIIRKKT